MTDEVTNQMIDNRKLSHTNAYYEIETLSTKAWLNCGRDAKSLNLIEAKGYDDASDFSRRGYASLIRRSEVLEILDSSISALPPKDQLTDYGVGAYEALKSVRRRVGDA